jgi:multiple sugar transport system ATP-binding protein
MSSVRVQAVSKHFKEKSAVKNINFEVREGEFLALVGPSGCGKTTTLRMISGLEATSEGQIFFGDKDVTNIRPRDRNIGMVFQDYAILPHLTVYENIAYGLRSRHAPRQLIDERVDKAAKTFQIDNLLKRKPRQLSGGQRQRVALARAMARDADVYLYDEPLSNLDVQLRHQAREDIMTLHEEKGKPSIYVTHDQSEAMAMGDRIAIMRSGELMQIGTGTELYEQPKSLFVAYFLGTPSINIFDARLEQSDAKLYVVNNSFNIELPLAIAEKVSQYQNKTIKLGIRPEDMHVPKMAPFPVTDGNTIKGLVTVIEPSTTGSIVYLHTLESDESKRKDFVATFKLRMPAQYQGKDIPLAIHPEKVHLFEAESERSLLYG